MLYLKNGPQEITISPGKLLQERKADVTEVGQGRNLTPGEKFTTSQMTWQGTLGSEPMVGREHCYLGCPAKHLFLFELCRHRP